MFSMHMSPLDEATLAGSLFCDFLPTSDGNVTESSRYGTELHSNLLLGRVIPHIIFARIPGEVPSLRGEDDRAQRRIRPLTFGRSWPGVWA